MTNKKLFKFFSALMVLVTLALALAACGDPTATTAPVATTAAATTTTAATTAAVATTAAATTTTAAAPAATTAVATTTAAPVATTAPAATTAAASALAPITGKITFWSSYGSGGSGEGKALDAALTQLKKDNPSSDVQGLDIPFADLFKKYETEVASGGGPDLFIAPNDSLGDEARAKLIANLDDKLKGKLDSNILPVAVNGSKVNGQFYMVPESLKAVAFFYNKDKVKTVPKTTDDLLALQKSGVKLAFNSGIYHLFGLSGAFGGKLMDDTGKCVADQGGFAESWKFMQDLKAAGAFLDGSGTKAEDGFQAGTYDAIIDGPWKTTDFKKGLGDKLALAPIPAGPKSPANPLTGVDGWYINPNLTGAKLDNAVNFALYMTSPKIEQLFIDLGGHIPANSSLKIADPITQGFATAVATGLPRPQVAQLANFWGNFGDAYTKATDSGADATKSVADACSAMNKANKF